MTQHDLERIVLLVLRQDEASRYGYDEQAKELRGRLETFLRSLGYQGEVRRTATIAWEQRDVDRLRSAAHAERPTIEEAFKAGYHCQWIRNELRYIFDPLMKPGDPDGALRAWCDALSGASK